ncbi:MAG: hypothetical protein N7Q72_04855, partial [Spiroplasma sp. Tabriz.8]|nr:hypothetical protein [Spiroplasma sp. Tabriz.8]
MIIFFIRPTYMRILWMTKFFLQENNIYLFYLLLLLLLLFICYLQNPLDLLKSSMNWIGIRFIFTQMN